MSKDNLDQLEKQVDQQIKDTENARKERVMSGDESALKDGEYVEMNGKVIMGEKKKKPGFFKWLWKKVLWPLLKGILLLPLRLLGIGRKR